MKKVVEGMNVAKKLGDKVSRRRSRDPKDLAAAGSRGSAPLYE